VRRWLGPALFSIALGATAPGQNRPDQLPPFVLTPPDESPAIRSTEDGLVPPAPPPPSHDELTEQRRRSEAGGFDLDAVSSRVDEVLAKSKTRSPAENILLGVVIVGAILSLFLLVVLLRLRRRL
jgi:hypothetical protein